MNQYPVSPNLKVGGLVWFARMLSKVRLNDAGDLAPEYQRNLGLGYDGWCLRFLGVSYPVLIQRVREGGTDEQILEWCYANGRRPTEIEIWTWNDCIRKRGWRDDWNGGSEKLERMKRELGFVDRSDIQTFFDLYEADEGRMPRAKKLPFIELCQAADEATIIEIINESAQAYKGVIPTDRWHDPYMPMAELRSEIGKGVRFYGYRVAGALVGVMGIQDVKDVTLIRHAYVRTSCRGQGIGAKLLVFLNQLTDRPVLIGTWKAATWAIRFYEKNGFELVTKEEKDRLLHTYWTVPARQIEESVVLVDQRWRLRQRFTG